MNTTITKTFDIEQPIGLVWKSLANPEEIVTCVPGASITEKVDDRNYKGEVVTKFGPIKAAYAGDIEIVELDEASHNMVLKGRGLDSKGKGSADMVMNGKLSEEGGKTKVDFKMDITIVGTLAQFGSRLINDVSDQLLNQFVASFREKLAAEGPATTETVDAGASGGVEAAATATDTPTEQVISTPGTTAKKDNSLNAFSLIGTVLKSILNSIIDFFKSLFGIKKK